MGYVVSDHKRRIVGLDGLRAFAVAAVILYHLLPTIFPGGYIGVDVFFVISGFLITTLLLGEHRETAKIDLKAFYRRRIRRLVPALLLVIGSIGSIALFVRGDVLVGIGRQVIGALTFSNNWLEIMAGTNYFDATNPHLFANFWSLAVEEQYYLVWPFVITGLLSLPLFAKRRNTGLLVSALLAVMSAITMAVTFDGQNATRVYYGADTHVFGLMLGSALAFWEYARTVDLPNRRLYDHTPFRMRLFGTQLPLQVLGAVGLVGMLGCIMMLSMSQQFSYRGGMVLASCCAALTMMAIVSKSGVLRKLFTLPALEWVGARSYGIYLWHWPIFVLLGTTLPPGQPLAIAMLTIGLAVAAAALSYRFLEQPVRSFGIRGTLRRSIKQKATTTNGVTNWRLQPHPVLIGAVALIALTTASIITAPAQTRAEAQIIAGEHAIQAAQAKAKLAAKKPKPPRIITGSDITFIGDSVTLAAAPALTTQYPGILIDAQISRSLRRGGIEDVQLLQAAGNLRPVVIVALGTNGYYGDGGLDELMALLKGHDVIFVTAHAPVEWVVPNNQEVRAILPRYPAVHIAEWDQAISVHPELLGPDDIHPGPTGGQLYADCIKAALAEIKQP
jgi:peptidoglycan/LPS O-acetylase OafA/YrhL